MVKLSVIIPIYNTPRELLDYCLSSIQENIRELEDVEILCMNDGSTESHVEQTLKEIENKDSRFKYIYKQNSGVANTRNMGIDMARGEYITFIDADDYLEPDALSYMLESVEGKNTDLIVFGYCNNEGDGISKEARNVVSELSCEDVVADLIANNIRSDIGISLASVWANLYKRDVILRNKVYFCQSIAPSEDGYFNLCFIQAIDKFYIDNRLVYHYVYYEGSAVHKFSDILKRTSINILPKLEDYVSTNYPERNDLKDAIAIRAYFYIREIKEYYFTHPQNTKSFSVLKSEMDEFLNNPIISKWIKKLRLLDAKDKIDFKNRLLLKLHLYWIFLITERRERKKHS